MPAHPAKPSASVGSKPCAVCGQAIVGLAPGARVCQVCATTGWQSSMATPQPTPAGSSPAQAAPSRGGHPSVSGYEPASSATGMLPNVGGVTAGPSAVLGGTGATSRRGMAAARPSGTGPADQMPPAMPTAQPDPTGLVTGSGSSAQMPRPSNLQVAAFPQGMPNTAGMGSLSQIGLAPVRAFPGGYPPPGYSPPGPTAGVPGNPAGPSGSMPPSGTAIQLKPVKSGVSAPPGYEILGELGRGGMGVVYKARDLRLGRTVALKMLIAGSHAAHSELDRFRIEAESVARLSHPNIVQIYEVGWHENLPFFALEFCAGGPLDRRIKGRPQPARQAAALIESVAYAVQTAHDAGLLHRDIKPANILLGDDGRPRLTDFGLAKNMGTEGLTATGMALGTPSYVSPEQAQSERHLTPAADVYSLGAVLYELLTGRPPFVGETEVHTVYLVLSEEPVAVRRLQPKVPVDLETICLKCLAKAPARRYATAAQLADDLRRFLDHKPIKARPVGPLEAAAKWAVRKPATAALVGVSALAVLLGLIGTVMFARRLNNQKAQLETRTTELTTAEVAARKARQTAETAANEAANARAEAEAALEDARIAQARAQNNLRLAVSAIDAFVKTLDGNSQNDSPELRRFRKDLLTLAQTFYRDIGQQVDSTQDSSTLAADLTLAQGRISALVGAIDTASSTASAAATTKPAVLTEPSPDPTLSANPAAAVPARLDEARRVVEAHRARYAQQPDDPRLALALGEALARYLTDVETIRPPDRLATVRSILNELRDLSQPLVQTPPASFNTASQLRVEQIYTDAILNLCLMPATSRDTVLLGQLELAISLVEKHLAGSPKDPVLLALCADLHYQAAVRVTPGDTVVDKLSSQTTQVHLQAAFNALSHLLMTQPDHPTARRSLANVANNLGLGLQNFGRITEARKTLLAARQELLSHLKKSPTDWNAHALLGAVCSNTGNTYLNTKDLSTAEEWYAQAVETLQKVFQNAPTNPDIHTFLTNAHIGWYQCLQMQNRYAEAAEHLRHAISYETRPLNKTKLEIDLASCLARAGQHVQARDQIRDTIARNRDANIEIQGTDEVMAEVLALCVAAARADAKLSAVEREQIPAQYANEAVRYLQLALQKNRVTWSKVKGHKPFQALVTYPAFQALAAANEVKTDGAAAPPEPQSPKPKASHSKKSH